MILKKNAPDQDDFFVGNPVGFRVRRFPVSETEMRDPLAARLRRFLEANPGIVRFRSHDVFLMAPATQQLLLDDILDKLGLAGPTPSEATSDD